MRLNRSSIAAVTLAAFTLLLSTAAFGQTAPAGASSPVGKWTWTQPGRGGDQQVTLTVTQDGDKLAGTLTMMDRDTPIQDASFKDGTLTFKVARSFNGQTMTTTYTGTISGDTLTAKSEQITTRDVTATRSK